MSAVAFIAGVVVALLLFGQWRDHKRMRQRIRDRATAARRP